VATAPASGASVDAYRTLRAPTARCHTLGGELFRLWAMLRAVARPPGDAEATGAAPLIRSSRLSRRGRKIMAATGRRRPKGPVPLTKTRATRWSAASRAADTGPASNDRCRQKRPPIRHSEVPPSGRERGLTRQRMAEGVPGSVGQRNRPGTRASSGDLAFGHSAAKLARAAFGEVHARRKRQPAGLAFEIGT